LKNTRDCCSTQFQYEGEEESPNIFYTAEAVGQQAIPAVDYLLEEGYTKFYLIGTDYVYPQTTNIVLFEYLLSKGIPLRTSVVVFAMKVMLLFLQVITHPFRSH
jgi:ABC-type branched-subunit amino acid transport system substrate-binding protein